MTLPAAEHDLVTLVRWTVSRAEMDRASTIVLKSAAHGFVGGRGGCFKRGISSRLFLGRGGV